MKSLVTRSWLTVGLVALLSATAACSSSNGSGKPSTSNRPLRPSVTSPAAERPAMFSQPPDLGHVIEPISASSIHLPADFVENELFASGTATAFTAGMTASDGQWTVSPTTVAPYKTRILVRRPTTQKAFNGTVVVEWMNVTSGESSPDWTYLNPELIRVGYAYVAVSAQALGVDGGKPLIGTKGSAPVATGLVTAEPSRYGTLHHPGDQYSYDMFAQIGSGLRLDKNSTLLGGLHPKRVVAVGESQSASFLTTFADAIQPRTEVFDGLFIHSRGGTGAPLNGSSIASNSLPPGQRIRIDLSVPVFMFETETDLTELGYAPARQPNTNRIGTWEVPGTAHADTYIVGSFASQLGCTAPINNGPQHVVIEAAFAAFDRWVNSGTAPPTPSPMALSVIKPANLHLARTATSVVGFARPQSTFQSPLLVGSHPPVSASYVRCSAPRFPSPRHA